MFQKYHRAGTTEMTRWHSAMDMAGVSISDADKANGSPKLGDYIARNEDNYNDKWLVSAEFFEKSKFVLANERV